MAAAEHQQQEQIVWHVWKDFQKLTGARRDVLVTTPSKEDAVRQLEIIEAAEVKRFIAEYMGSPIRIRREVNGATVLEGGAWECAVNAEFPLDAFMKEAQCINKTTAAHLLMQLMEARFYINPGTYWSSSTNKEAEPRSLRVSSAALDGKHQAKRFAAALTDIDNTRELKAALVRRRRRRNKHNGKEHP